MELNAVSNLIFAAIILLIAGGFYLAFYLRSLQAEIGRSLYQLYFVVTQRTDLLPLYIETLAGYFSKDSFDELIKLRYESMLMKGFGSPKKAKESEIWKLFDDLLNSASGNPEIKKNVILSALNKDLTELNKKVIEQSNFYNKLVDRYNSLARNILLKPVSMMVSRVRFERF